MNKHDEEEFNKLSIEGFGFPTGLNDEEIQAIKNFITERFISKQGLGKAFEETRRPEGQGCGCYGWNAALSALKSKLL